MILPTVLSESFMQTEWSLIDPSSQPIWANLGLAK